MSMPESLNIKSVTQHTQNTQNCLLKNTPEKKTFHLMSSTTNKSLKGDLKYKYDYNKLAHTICAQGH